MIDSQIRITAEQARKLAVWIRQACLNDRHKITIWLEGNVLCAIGADAGIFMCTPDGSFPDKFTLGKR